MAARPLVPRPRLRVRNGAEDGRQRDVFDRRHVGHRRRSEPRRPYGLRLAARWPDARPREGGYRPDRRRGSAPGDAGPRLDRERRLTRREGPARRLRRPRLRDERLRLPLLHDEDAEQSDLPLPRGRQCARSLERVRRPRQHRLDQQQPQRRDDPDRAGRKALGRAGRFGHGRREVAGHLHGQVQRQGAPDEPRRLRALGQPLLLGSGGRAPDLGLRLPQSVPILLPARSEQRPIRRGRRPERPRGARCDRHARQHASRHRRRQLRLAVPRRAPALHGCSLGHLQSPSARSDLRLRPDGRATRSSAASS